MELKYREATIEDADMLIDIYNASFYKDYIRYGNCPGYGKTKEMMENSILSYSKLIILCDKKAVGVISCEKIENETYEVGCLCVIPEYQGLGIGTAAFEFAMSYYKDGKGFTLVTPADKEENVRFYTQKCGFHVVSNEMDGKTKLVRFYRDR